MSKENIILVIGPYKIIEDTATRFYYVRPPFGRKIRFNMQVEAEQYVIALNNCRVP